jgi:hypothetical protein
MRLLWRGPGVLRWALVVLVAGVATVPLSGVASARVQEVQESWCGDGWDISHAWGASAGQPCWNPSRVKGWVADRAADDRCVFMRFTWYRNGYRVDSKDSPPACGKGARHQFTLRSADPYANWANWDLLQA